MGSGRTTNQESHQEESMGTAPDSTRLFDDTLPGVGMPAHPRIVARNRPRASCWIRDEEKDTIWGKTEEIALDGLIICSDRTPPLGSEVKLRLHTDHGDLLLTGTVVHRLHGIGFGCRFTRLNEQQRVALRYLRTVQQTTRQAA